MREFAFRRLSDRNVYCGFCGKSNHKVAVLIHQDEIVICDECVDICARLVREYYWSQRYERWKEFGP